MTEQEEKPGGQRVSRRNFMGLAGAGMLAMGVGIPSIGPAFAADRKGETKGKILRITAVGHSTFLLDFGGTKILTDPCFSDNFGFPAELKGYRRNPLKLHAKDLPSIDAIISTHRHPDHFDVGTLEPFNRKIPFFVSDDHMVQELTKMGFSWPVQVKPWDEHQISGVMIAAVPAREGTGLTQVGYVLVGNGLGVYFGGDTMEFPEIIDVAARYSIDIAMPPVNGVKVGGRLVCMTPEQAAEASIRLNAKVAIPQHYDAFFEAFPAYEPNGTPEQFANAVANKSKNITVKILKPGDSFEVSV